MTTMKNNKNFPIGIRSTSMITTIWGLVTGVFVLTLTMEMPVVVASATTVTANGTPKIAFVETEVSYGDLLQGEVIERDILVRNDGDAELKIWRADPSCGCTRILNFPDTVAPGEIAKVRIEIDSKKVKDGSTRKGVTLESNDPNQPRHRFIFTMNIINLFYTAPKPIKLSGLMSSSKSARIKLIAATDLGFEIVGARSRNGHFEITDFQNVEEDRLYEIEVTTGTADAPKSIKDPLDLLIRVKDGREVVVGRYVEIDHLDPIQVSPPRVLQFGNKDTDPLLGADAVPVVSKLIQVQNVDPGFTLEVKDVVLEGFPEGLFGVEIQEVVPGRIFRIELSLEEYRKEVLLRGSLTIVTNDPREPKRTLVVAAKFGRL